MIYKWFCLVTVLLIILLHHLTKQHYMPPLDFCAFAKTCYHTGESICGIETKNLITRLFLDDCDLFEYNCDHHKDYIKTGTEKCPPNETVLKTTMASTSTTFLLNTYNIETLTENNSEIVNTTVMKSSTKPATETVITTSLQINPSLNITKGTPMVTCVCPNMRCLDSNITTTMISPIDNSTTIAVKSTETTIVSTIAEATINSTSLKATIISINNETTKNLTSTRTTKNSTYTEAKINLTITKAITNSTIPDATINLTSIEATTNSTSTEATTNSTITQAIINLSRTEKTINSTISTLSINSTNTETTINPLSIEASTNLTNTEIPTSALTTVSIITNRINSSKSVSTLTTCTISKTTSLETEVSSTTVATSPKDKKMVLPQFKEDEKVTVDNDPKTSEDKCTYPKHCNRPSTWETTAKGEIRDFYQILRAQFGDRVTLLRDTTHFPRRFEKNFSDDDEGFQFGYHNEKTNEIQSK